MFATRNEPRGSLTAGGNLLLCTVSGAVFSLPYFFEPLFPLTYLSLGVFLFLRGREEVRKMAFRSFFCFLLGFLFPLYTWFSALYPLSATGLSRTSAFGVVSLCCIGIPLLQAAVQAAVLQFARFLPDGSDGASPFLRAVGCGALWVLSEKLLAFGSLALPWGTVALSQTGCLPLLETVSLFGADWLAFLCVTVCALCAEAFRCGRKCLLACGSGLLALAFLAGGVLLALPDGTDGTVLAAAVQGNLSTDEKWEDETLRNGFETYRDLTEQAAKRGAKVILLPESAVPVPFAEGGPLHEAFASVAQTYDCTVLLGVLRRDGDGRLHNSLAAVLPDGTVRGYYDKQHPVPFGEVLPFRGLIQAVCPPLAELNLGEELTVSPTDATLDCGAYRVGCFLCFDSVFGGREQAGGGTDFSVIATNDAWFRDSAGVYQHLRYAKLRAAESGRALLRAGNTGVSALLDGKGRVLRQTEPLEQTVLYGELPTGGRNTLFGRTGSLFPALSAAYLLTLTAFALARRAKRRRKK